MFDVLVIGAGPTGLSAAIMAAQAGLNVAVTDPKSGTIDKACGEGLMPSAVAMLEEMGVQIPQGHPFTGIRYIREDVHADGHFTGEPGLGVRRLVLHKALRTRAEALGVHFFEEKIHTLGQLDAHVEANDFRARWVFAADGLRSPIRKLLGLDIPSTRAPRFGLRQHFRAKPWSPYVEVYWSDDVEAYVTPVAEDQVGVAFLYGQQARNRDRSQPGTPIERLFQRFPALRARLGEPMSHPRGAGPFAVEAKNRRHGRVFLLGDAAGYLDPITGEGIKLGLLSARAAVDCVVASTPKNYDAEWRRIYRPYALSTGGLLTLTRWTWARRLMVPVLKRAPWLFDRILRTLVA